MKHKKCMACKVNPNTECPDYIDETHLTQYIRRLNAMDKTYADAILADYLVYCEMGKLCLCVSCTLKFTKARNDLIEQFGGEGWLSVDV